MIGGHGHSHGGHGHSHDGHEHSHGRSHSHGGVLSNRSHLDDADVVHSHHGSEGHSNDTFISETENLTNGGQQYDVASSSQSAEQCGTKCGTKSAGHSVEGHRKDGLNQEDSSSHCTKGCGDLYQANTISEDHFSSTGHPCCEDHLLSTDHSSDGDNKHERDHKYGDTASVADSEVSTSVGTIGL